MKIKSREQIFEEFFSMQNWKAQPFQKTAFDIYQKFSNIFISVPTGSGKTIAAFLPALIELLTRAIHSTYFS